MKQATTSALSEAKQAVIMQAEQLTPRQTEAYTLHMQIRTSITMAGDALIEFCRGLKSMKESGLYSELGFSEFGEYTEGALNIKQRQAYNYIHSFEKHSAEFLHLNANLGITKLEILTALPEPEREAFVSENNVNDMTAAELKETVNKLTAAETEISNMREELLQLNAKRIEETVTATTAIRKELSEEFTRCKQATDNRILQLNAKIQELEEANGSDETLADELEELRREHEELLADIDERIAAAVGEELDKAEEEKKRMQAEHNDNVKKIAEEIKAAAQKNTQREFASKIEQSEKELQALRAELAAAEKYKDELTAEQGKREKLEKQLQISSNPDLTRFKYTFEQFQTILNETITLLNKLDEINRMKCTAALKAVLGGVSL